MAPGQPDADCGLVGASHTEVGTRRHAPAGGRPASLRVPPSERTGLYRLVQHHAASFIAHTDAELPQFIKDEFEAFLECGILARLPEGALRGMRPRQAAGVQLQAAWVLSLVWCAAHVADSGAPGRPRHSARSCSAKGSAHTAAVGAKSSVPRREGAGSGNGDCFGLDVQARGDENTSTVIGWVDEGPRWGMATAYASGPGFIQEDESLAWQYGDRAVSRRVPVCGRTTLSRSVAPTSDRQSQNCGASRN